MRVTDEPRSQRADDDVPARALTAGSALRDAREAAGLSIDAVARQLKLAPRQVQALEDDDFERLPGRTFARGFARNYARFLHLDADAVLALMPAPDRAPALERPTFSAARRPMGEMPVQRAAQAPSSARSLAWLLVLLAIASAFGYYEFVRPRGGSTPGAAAPKIAAPETAPRSAPAGDAPGTSTTMSLPNPVAETPQGAADKSPASPATGATAGATTAAGPTAEAPLVLTFRGTSWAEVRDAQGRVVLQMTGVAGIVQTVAATPPLELALGSARDVAVTFRGQALDLSPYTRGSVARVALK
jgi:cytoskeleton protein RodZ